MSTGPPAPPAGLSVPPPPSHLTMRGSTMAPVTPAGSIVAAGGPNKFGTNPPQFGTNPPQFGTNPPQFGTNPPQFGTNPPRPATANANINSIQPSPNLTRSSTIATTSQPTAEELGVKWVDTGKTDISEDDRRGWRSFRKNVANEILSTEKSYVESLNKMLIAYNEPYVNGQRGTGLTDKKVASLFTLPKTIVGIANTFLVDIEIMIKNWDNDETIAPSFIRYAPMFRTYRDYSSQHQQVITTILGKINSRSAFTSFQLKQMTTMGCMDLASYLIMPIQRLPRYKLLLESLISKTESTHPQAPLLLQALKLISEVALSVNDAMKAALLVERYMEVQKLFKSGEAVHLWRKLLVEIPCRISRIWSPSTPAIKGGKEKKEKKHRFVSNDAVIFLFTDCLWLGIKTKDREKRYEDTRTSLDPYPLYADDFNYKFSLLTVGLHTLSTSFLPQPQIITDHSYHHSIILTSPVHAICVTFDTQASKDSAYKVIIDTVKEFENTSRRTINITDVFIDTSTNGKPSDVICCDRCQTGLYQHLKTGSEGGKAYNTLQNHICCNRCNSLICTANCLHEDQMFEKSAQQRGGLGGAGNASPLTPASGQSALPGAKGFGFRPSTVAPSQSIGGSKTTQLLGNDSRIISYPSTNPVHASIGWGASSATGRWCKACQAAPPVALDVQTAGFNNGSGPAANQRDTLRNSYIGTLTAGDLASIRARQNKPQITAAGALRINTNPDNDDDRRSLTLNAPPLPTPSSRSNNNDKADDNSPSTPSHNSVSHLRATAFAAQENSRNDPPQSLTTGPNNASRNTTTTAAPVAAGGAPGYATTEPPSPIAAASPSVPNLNLKSPPPFSPLTLPTPSPASPALVPSTSVPPNVPPSLAPLPSTGAAPPPFNPRASSVSPPPFTPQLHTTSSTSTNTTPLSHTHTPSLLPINPPPFSGNTPNQKFATSPPQPPKINIKPSTKFNESSVSNQPSHHDSDDDEIPPPPVINFGKPPPTTGLFPPPTPSTTTQSQHLSNISTSTTSTTTRFNDDEDIPPAPPTIGGDQVVGFTPQISPSNKATISINLTTPPPPEVDSESELAPPPYPPTPKAAFSPPTPRAAFSPPPPPQQSLPTPPPQEPPQPPPQALQPPPQPIQRSNPLGPKQMTKRPSI